MLLLPVCMSSIGVLSRVMTPGVCPVMRLVSFIGVSSNFSNLSVWSSFWNLSGVTVVSFATSSLWIKCCSYFFWLRSVGLLELVGNYTGYRLSNKVFLGLQTPLTLISISPLSIWTLPFRFDDKIGSSEVVKDNWFIWWWLLLNVE